MRGLWRWLGRIGLVILVVIAGCTIFYPRAIIHVRVTATVDTPEGLRTGSSVVQLGFSTEPPIGTTGFSMGLGAGEAIAVDLGNRGTLFVLLSALGSDGRVSASPSYAGLLLDVFRAQLGDDAGRRDQQLVRRLQGLRGKAVVAPAMVPMLVRFRDERDPKTVEAVDRENLAASFGAGVRLGSVTMEITNDPVTRGMEKRLGWLSEYYGKNFDGQRFASLNAANKLANQLSSGSFAVGN